MTYFHGSKNGELNLENGSANFGGALFVTKSHNTAEDYAVSGQIYTVEVNDDLRILNTGDREQVAEFFERYWKDFGDTYQCVTPEEVMEQFCDCDLNANSVWDNPEAQEIACDCGFDAIQGHDGDILAILRPSETVIAVARA